MVYVKTGIAELDRLLKGGIRKGSLVVVSGKHGTALRTKGFSSALLSSLQSEHEKGVIFTKVGRADWPEVPTNIDVRRGNITNNLFRFFFSTLDSSSVLVDTLEWSNREREDFSKEYHQTFHNTGLILLLTEQEPRSGVVPERYADYHFSLGENEIGFPTLTVLKSRYEVSGDQGIPIPIVPTGTWLWG